MAALFCSLICEPIGLYKHFYKDFLFPVLPLCALKQLFTKVESLGELHVSYQWDFLIANQTCQ